MTRDLRTAAETGRLAAISASVGITFADPMLEETIRSSLDVVESGLRQAVTSADPLLSETGCHLLHAGGKRIRPLLVALAAQFGQPASSGAPVAPAVAQAGMVVELTHLATLYHDDVMDDAPVRRGGLSANARWGNSIAILTGDFLFAKAADLAADLGPEAVRIQARTFSRLVHGQIAETVGPRGGDPVQHYLRVVADKTGSLIGTSARFGAMFSGASPQVVEAMTGYGDTIGVAFQLSDDLLDIEAESVTSGKLPGTDLREGVPTLPVLYALAEEASNASAVRLREILRQGPISDEAVLGEALDLLRDSAALKRARETVRGYAEQARAAIVGLPDGPARRALESLAVFITDRSA